MEIRRVWQVWNPAGYSSSPSSPAISHGMILPVMRQRCSVANRLGVTSRLKINLDRINERLQPLQQLLMDSVSPVSLERCPVDEFHRPAQLVSLRTR
jgi:hypothetical protein